MMMKLFTPLLMLATVLPAAHAAVPEENVAAVLEKTDADSVAIDSMAPAAPLLPDSAYAFNDPAAAARHPWKAALQTFGINVGVWAFDRFVLNADFARISPATISHNIRNGFVWDNDKFSTNLFAHPYHGSLYYNTARSNGLSFWQSAPYAFAGSLMWETTCEIEPPAINDFIATSIGGVCIGEVTHRLSSLVYDDRTTGFARFFREFIATAICPIRGLNRILSGDAWRVRHSYYKYHDYSRLPVAFSASAGMRYLADRNSLFRGESNPYVTFDVVYGDAFSTTANAPYDYFTAEVTFGLSSNQPLVSSVHLLGRLWGRELDLGNNLEAQFGLFQHFNYYDSQPVKDGTSLVPYRISEAAAIGPGIIYRFPRTGNLRSLEQSLFVDAILLGGSLSDHYNIIDRDYNMGSGYSAKVRTTMDFGKTGAFSLNTAYYAIFTWKGYEGKDLAATDPLYLNAQGDRSRAQLLVVSTRFLFSLSSRVGLDLSSSFYLRHTRYKYHDNVLSRTFTTSIGLLYHL